MRIATSRPDRSSASSVFLGPLLFAIVCIPAAELGYLLSPLRDISGRTIVTFWPPSGLLLAVLLLSEVRRWPAYLSAALVADVVSMVLVHEEFFSVSLSVWFGNSVGALTGAWLIRRLLGHVPTMDSLSEVFAFTTLAALPGTTLGVTFSAALSSLAVGDRSFWAHWPQLWAGEIAGVLAFTPLLLVGAEIHLPSLRRPHPYRLAEAAALFVALPAVGCLLADKQAAFFGTVFIIPGLLWGTLRFGKIGTAIIVLITALLMTGNAATNRGLLATAASTSSQRIVLAQVFFSVLSVTFWFLGGVLHESSRARKELLASRALYTSLVENLPVCLFCKDLSGRFLFANRQFCDLLQKPLEDIVGKTDRDFFPPELAEAYQRDDRRIIESRAPLEQEEEHRSPGRESRLVQVLKVPLTDGQGQIIGIQGIFWDITARARAEEAVRRSEERYRSVVELSPETILILQDNRIAYTNAAGVAMFAASRLSDLLSKPVGEFVHPEERAVAQERCRIVLESGQVVPPRQYRVQRLDGTWIDVESRGGPCVYQGRPAIQVIVRDITEQKRAELALRQSEERFASFMRHLPGLAWIKDLQGRYVYVNDTAERVFRIPRVQLYGKTDAEVFPAETAAEFKKNDQQALASGTGVQTIETLLHEDGILHHAMVSKFPMAGPDGRPMLVGGTAFDITERKVAEDALARERILLAQRVEERTRELSLANAELARADRLKDEFLANMSHELRTPLTSILGLTEVLRDQLQGPLNEKQLQNLRTIEESGRHLLALINDILDLTKIGAGKLELECGLVRVASVCQASLQLIRQAAHSKRLRVEMDLDPNATTLRADERRLKQILVNLLANAVKFTPPGGAVGLDVAGDVEGQVIRFTVWDTGVGIPWDQLDQLFQPFVQLEGGLARRHEGTGLGLLLVERMAKLHNGGVTVESEHGKGSRFIVTIPWQGPVPEREVLSSDSREFPARPVDLSPAPGRTDWQSVLQPEPAGKKPVVLVAEDTEAIANLISMLLSARGYQVFVARDGRQALQRAEQCRPDLILTDIHMPGMHGLELIRHLRARAALSEIPIVVLTGHGGGVARAACLEAGANDLLQKPFAVEDLHRAVEKYCKRGGRSGWGNTPHGAEEAAPLAAVAPSGRNPAVAPGQMRSILLAEDNEATIHLLSNYLSAQGYRALVARNGTEALERALEDRPALILMDIQMPGMHGLEVLRRLRAEPTLAEVPVIAVTALAMPGDRERCLEAGANEYLSKPFQLEVLLGMIQTRLRSSGQ